VGTNLLSEWLLAISSKGHGTGVKPDDSVDRTVIAATAQTILQQPEEKRENLITQLSGYMALPDVLGGEAKDIEAKLRELLAASSENPWLKKAMPKLPAKANDNHIAVNDDNKQAASNPGNKIGSIQHIAPVQAAPMPRHHA
jgi:predicted Zn-dependent protease